MRLVMPEDWVIPAIEPNTEAFFTSGRMLIQRCTACGYLQHPPEDICHACQRFAFDLQECSGRGTIFSFTVVHHAVHPSLETPYTVVLVSLDDAPHVRIVGNLIDVPHEEVHIGMSVRALWEEVHDTNTGETILLPQWVQDPTSS